MRSIVAVLLILIAPAAARAEDLQSFLDAATGAVLPRATVRADGELVTTSPDGSTRDRLAIVQRPNGDVYYELHASGVRALLLADGTARVVPGPGKRSTAFPLDAPLGTSELTAEDLRPFRAAHYSAPQIADRSADDVTVLLTPEQSQYALQVITFDRAKKVPLVTKCYKDTINNLVKMRRDSGLTALAGTWLPGSITMENFPMRVVTTATLAWRESPEVPALFDPAALDRPSPLTWPTP